MKKSSVHITETVHTISVYKTVVFFLSCIILGVGGGGVYLFIHQKNPLGVSTIQNVQAQKDTEALVIKVGTFFDLPTGETPTIATVSDKTKLQKQPFFAKAENGDKVLIYTNAKKAILYRPSSNKIMEVAPLAINSPSNTSSIEVDPRVESTIINEKEVTVSIYNGTKTLGLASGAEQKITNQFKNITVKEKKDAKNDYTSTVVIDTTGSNSDTTKKIASLLGGSVGQMPTEEQKPQGEILVIMGE